MWLYFEVPKEIAAAFPCDDAHITFLCLGDIQPKKLNAVISIIKNRVLELPTPLRFKLGKLDYFENPDGRVAVCAVRTPQWFKLSEIRTAIWGDLLNIGVTPEDIFPNYIPHATLEYMEEDEEYEGTVPSGEWSTDYMLLGIDDKIQPIFLKTATKTETQKLDEEAASLLLREPKFKPPRRDLKKKLINTADPDLKSGVEGDRDLSLNYKKVAAEYEIAVSPSHADISEYCADIETVEEIKKLIDKDLIYQDLRDIYENVVPQAQMVEEVLRQYLLNDLTITNPILALVEDAEDLRNQYKYMFAENCHSLEYQMVANAYSEGLSADLFSTLSLIQLVTLDDILEHTQMLPATNVLWLKLKSMIYEMSDF